MAETTKPDASQRDRIPAPETEDKRQQLPESELNKVTGGGGDPCEGGELHRR